MVCILSIFAHLAPTAPFIQEVPGYHLNPLHHLFPKLLHQFLLAIFLFKHRFPADVRLEEALEEGQEVFLYNCEDVHLEGGLMFGEAVDAVRRAEDDHLHPQALHQALSLFLASLHLIEEDGQGKGAHVGKEVEAEERRLFLLSMEVPNAPAQLDDDQLIFGMLLNPSIKVLAWILRGELPSLC